MTKLVATQPMLRAARRLSRDAVIQKFIQKAASGKLKVKQAVEPAKKIEPKVGDPTPQRVDKVEDGALVEVKAPPFNSRVMPVVTRYADRLGSEVVLILEQLYEIGRRGEAKRGLTAGYDGFKVDVSRTSYAHLTPAESKAYDTFRRAMRTLPPELRAYATELLFGEEDARKPMEIARELCRYDSDHGRRGALVAALRIIAWCVRGELSQGGKDGKSRARKAKEVLLP